jgi:hypothetical protein
MASFATILACLAMRLYSDASISDSDSSSELCCMQDFDPEFPFFKMLPVGAPDVLSCLPESGRL